MPGDNWKKTIFTFDYFSKKAIIIYNHNNKTLPYIKLTFLVFFQSQRILKSRRMNMGSIEWRDGLKTLRDRQVAIFQIAFIISLAIASKMEGDDACEKFPSPIRTWLLHVWKFSTKKQLFKPFLFYFINYFFMAVYMVYTSQPSPRPMLSPQGKAPTHSPKPFSF